MKTLSHNLMHLGMKNIHQVCLNCRSIKQSSLQGPKQKRSLNLYACSCSISRSNLSIAISEYEQGFEAPVAVPFICKRWFLSNKEQLLNEQICNPSNTLSVDGLFESLGSVLI